MPAHHTPTEILDFATRNFLQKLNKKLAKLGQQFPPVDELPIDQVRIIGTYLSSRSALLSPLQPDLDATLAELVGEFGKCDAVNSAMQRVAMAAYGHD